ncbi:hypothetical protein [Pedobacter sandarakinus]|uniref:hypothetical protein n=1 Tax=Pedobacter sandarakinus TaxID=353156 RepID=UPI002246B346|nr:hypothetical protein [Pedobacter sandarakinus]MCX2574274.1 hypothetical protein [Pedobacter sandarakinus]
MKVKDRSENALGGTAFAKVISDGSINLKSREKLIFKEIRHGNIPKFLRKLVKCTDTIEGSVITFFVLPDYLAIGNDTDFVYMPMTPILAQRIANLTKCTLPTKTLVDRIHKHAEIKLKPQPIPPSDLMTTVPVFVAHTDSVRKQLSTLESYAGKLTSGNKKDIIVSNKIYAEQTARVVIYGWHQQNGKPIQPVYNRHTNLWADYSHGIRLIQDKIYIDNKKASLKKAIKDVRLWRFFSDEGLIAKPYYPVSNKY